MTAYLLRRILVAGIVLLLVSTLVFMLLRLLPGDPVLLILGSDRTPSPEVVERVRSALGLDQPLIVQYGRFITSVMQFDLGESLYDGRPVAGEILRRLPRTLGLVLAATAVGVVAGVFLAMRAAVGRNKFEDAIISALIATGISTPVYVLGMILFLIFVAKLQWFPSSGYVPFSESPQGYFRHLVLPSLTLGINMAPAITRVGRSALLEILGEDFMRTARAKGLPERIVLYRHGLRGAFAPILTTVGLQFGTLLGGSVLVEYIFNWPGLSTLLMQSIASRDYPMAQGVLLTIAFAFTAINLLVDICCAWLDPRVRYS